MKMNTSRTYTCVLPSLIALCLLLSQGALAQPAVQWQKTYGGGSSSATDNSIRQTAAGGYIVAGYASKNGQQDASLKLLDGSGAILWTKTYGGSSYDKFTSVIQTVDGGFIALGESNSIDGDVTGHHGTTGNSDYWVVKTDGLGAIQWKHAYGGTQNENAGNIIATADGAYLISGSTGSSDGDVSGFHGSSAFFFDGWMIKIDNAGNILWQKTLGGTGTDAIASQKQTPDGGFIVLGQTNSTDGDVSGFHGGYADYWIAKLNSAGIVSWQKCLGGTGADYGYDIGLTADGGYIVAGTSTSNDADVSGHHGAAGNYDAWLAKLDGTGTLQWQKSYGGSNDEDAKSVQQTTDGGYIFGGSAMSTDGDVSGLHGAGADAWVVKLDAVGTISWQKALGGMDTEKINQLLQAVDGGFCYVGYSSSFMGGTAPQYWIQKLDNTGNVSWQKNNGASIGNDYAYSIQQTSDGGYIMVGDGNTEDGDFSGGHGLFDIWLVKTDASGVIQWQKALGGSANDYANVVRQTPDGGYVVAGEINSSNGIGTGNHGMNDALVIKLDAAGNTQWAKTYGGTQGDYFTDIQYTPDGGYIMTGITNSNNGDVSGFKGAIDAWVVKIDGAGAIQWQKTLGGSGYDYGRSIINTADGGFIVASDAGSNDGDITGNHGSLDYWLVKLTSSGSISWQKTYGGTGVDNIRSVVATTDGGIVMTGFASSNDGDATGNHGAYDYWVVKTDAAGVIQWQKSLGGSGSDYAYAIKQTADGGYVIAGDVLSNDGDVSGNHGSYDYWIVKLDGMGAVAWKKTMGGAGEDDAHDIVQTADGGYIIMGDTKSNDGDVSANHGASTGSFDFWTVKLSSGAALPVTLLSFTAQQENKDIKVNWSCTDQLQFSHYEIERSADAIHFEKAGTVFPANTPAMASYSFNDADAANKYAAKGRLYYRLKMVDLDGSYTYSKTVQLAFTNKPFIAVSPNPVRDRLYVKGLDGYKQMRIMDANGKVLQQQVIRQNNETLMISQLKAGIFILQISNANETINYKLLKQ